jgi:hypothetical protein
MRAYVRLGLLVTLLLALTVLAGKGAPAYAWSDPLVLNTNADSDSGGDWYPQLATDGAGNWLAVWTSYDSLGGTIGTENDILVSRSTDNGASWTAPAALNTNAATDQGYDLHPKVTTDGAGNWLVVWWSDETLGDTIDEDDDILMARSTDNGVTWTPPVPLNSNAATDSGDDWDPQVATDGGGNWLAVWDSYDSLGGTIGTDHDILTARSTDSGATWTPPTPLNTNAATDSDDDWEPQATTDGAGNWLVVWWSEDTLGGTIGLDDDILVARSTDNGATWTAPVPLNTNAVTDAGDDWHPQVATDGAGNWLAVWHSDENVGGTIEGDRDILVSRSTNNGVTWAAPTPLNSNAETDSGDDLRPKIATDAAGDWLVVWRSDENLGGTIETDYDILVARSTDNGASWTAAAVLNANAQSDSGDDWNPQVATDGEGNWLTAWNSNENLSGDIGTDYDILCANELPPPVGGIAELPDVSGSAGRNYVAVAALAAAALVALGAGGWYARRRWLG